MQFHRMNIEEVLKELKTGRQGLSVEEAVNRLALYGRNELEEKNKKTLLMMFLGQFTDFMILVLIGAALISGVIGEISDSVAIVVIVVLNAVLGFVQEYRAERAMAALKKMASSSAMVMRSGILESLPAWQLVPGDVVVLHAGNIIPADMRIVEAARLSVEEAALTGESVAVEKHPKPIDDEKAPLGDRKNMLYKGTFIRYGRGAGVVTATGMETELGRIAAMIQTEEEAKTPLQKRLGSFGRKLAYAVLGVCLIIFLTGLLRGEEPVKIFLIAVSLAVAAIPEALPAVVTISLAIAARKMARQNALIRSLPAVETLGSITYICTDKTGTLTVNRMTVEEIYVDGKVSTRGEGGWTKDEKESPISHFAFGTPHSVLLSALALSNDARIDSSGNVIGDPTEAAFLSVSSERGFEKEKLEKLFPRVAELPFDSERKLMTTFHKIPPAPPFYKGGMGGIYDAAGAVKYLSFTKGAVEVLLKKSVSVLTSTGLLDIDRGQVLSVSERMARDGLRVLAIGMRSWEEIPRTLTHDHAEEKLILLGLVGMIDPPRVEASKSVAVCKSAGIVPVMITGDHPLTAQVVARRVGILDSFDPAAVITGRELATLPIDQLEKRVDSIRVYARVAPEQKLKIVRGLQEKGHFVAMTGDGVNDAPALKAADIGVAMGITGTDVAKEASSMILLDDNFATIVKAVREGRRIYDNIRKFIKYLLTTNSGEIWTLFLAPFMGLPMPLQPIHILWINLLTDGLPALALSLEPEEGNLMKRPPRHPQESIFAGGLGAHAAWVGVLMAGVVLSLQAWALRVGDDHWQTMVFTALCFLQLGHVLAIRSERESLFKQGLLTNKPLLLSVVVTVALQLCTVYIPSLNPIFKTKPLSIAELTLVFVLSGTVFVAVEIEKYFHRRTAKRA